MFVNIKAYLRNANKDYSKELDWLKSLRPQRQWKPSEMQLDTLEQIIDGEPYDRDLIIKLFNDLKKL